MNVIRKYAKAVAALLGGITPPVLIGIAHLVGWDIDIDTAVVLVGILSPLFASVATWGAPANTVLTVPDVPEVPPAA